MERETPERQRLGSRAVPVGPLALLLGIALLVLLLGGCRGEGNASAPPTPSSSPTVPATATPSPTPDPLALVPGDAASAKGALERYLAAGQASICDEAVRQEWEATCATGDLDGDGEADAALLVPLAGAGLRASHPAVVFVQRGGAGNLEQFPTSASEAASSDLALQLFGIADRTGDGRADLVYLTELCTSRSCNARVEIQSWDGTAWRNAGPADAGINNLESAEFTGAGAPSTLTLRGGKIESLEDGPTRSATVTYSFDGVRYSATKVEYDPPAYLYHAIVDADALFDRKDFGAAAAAYRAAIENTSLKDWKQEQQGIDGRSFLAGYALFRIAVATAAQGKSPTVALDEAIGQGPEEVFRYAAEAFRSGYQERSDPHQGCLRVTSYLATPPIPDRLLSMFNYGIANFPVKTSRDVCPL